MRPHPKVPTLPMGTNDLDQSVGHTKHQAGHQLSCAVTYQPLGIPSPATAIGFPVAYSTENAMDPYRRLQSGVDGGGEEPCPGVRECFLRAVG